MRNKSTKPSPKLQEKRAKLIELSAQAKKLRQQKIDNAQTAEEALFWQTRTVNYMLLHHVYSDGGTRFETFNEWKAQGATIKKGAKATVIWGQPRQGVATLEQKIEAAPNTVPTDENTAEEYEFFPLCFLFSEDDVYFTNAEQAADEATEQAAPANAVPTIDNNAFNEI